MFELKMKMNWGQVLTASFHTIMDACNYSNQFKCVQNRTIETPAGKVWTIA